MATLTERPKAAATRPTAPMHHEEEDGAWVETGNPAPAQAWSSDQHELTPSEARQGSRISWTMRVLVIAVVLAAVGMGVMAL